MQLPIIDLHCDLLSYLALDQSRTPFDSTSRCAFAHMQQGGVHLQTLAIFTTTSVASVTSGAAQIASLQKLLTEQAHIFAPFNSKFSLSSPLIHLAYALENASALAGEEEHLDVIFTRFNRTIKTLGNPQYISLTWNGENRFGGGCGSVIGLKPDGKELLTFLSKKKIAVDLSHASDELAWDILNFIDSQSLEIKVIASHSNFRSIMNKPRNLPDPLAQEIIRRKGVIGLNLFAAFLGSPELIVQHVQHALQLGGENALCFGADFFCDTDFTDISIRHPGFDSFFPEYADASSYPQILRKLSCELELPSSILNAISHGNALRFMEESVQERAQE